MAKSGISDPGKGGIFETSFFCGFLKNGTRTFFQNLKFPKSHVPAIQKILILSETASNQYLAAGAICHLFFYGLDVEIRPKWTLPGSAPTHPSCLSTRGGAIGNLQQKNNIFCLPRVNHPRAVSCNKETLFLCTPISRYCNVLSQRDPNQF